MRAAASVVARSRAQRTVLETVRSEPPIVLRQTPGALQMVGGTAGPLGGDRLELDVDVGLGADLAIRSVAASMLLPGPEPSTTTIRAVVDAGGSLDWAPEPMISVVGSRHTLRSLIDLAPHSRLRWRETLVLGRSDERPGAIHSSFRVQRGGVALLHHGIRVGDDGWDGPAVLGGARVMISELMVGPVSGEQRVVTTADGRAARFPIGEDAVLTMVMAYEVPAAEYLLGRVCSPSPGGRGERAGPAPDFDQPSPV